MATVYLYMHFISRFVIDIHFYTLYSIKRLSYIFNDYLNST